MYHAKLKNKYMYMQRNKIIFPSLKKKKKEKTRIFTQNELTLSFLTLTGVTVSYILL